MFLSLSFCTSDLFAHADEKENWYQLAQIFIPANAKLVKPARPYGSPSILEYDFNQDNQNELIITYQIKNKLHHSPPQFCAMVLSKQNAEWIKVWETCKQGVELDFSGLVDMTGDGIKEYLFSRTIGASAGSELEVYNWKQDSLKQVTIIPYHRMDFVMGDQRIGIAAWMRKLADAYTVDVVSWDGENMVLDDALYAHYYPVIKQFFKKKISARNAWYYWYCLADSQIKANHLTDATMSIEKGMKVTEKESWIEAQNEFKKLKHMLENKKKRVWDNDQTHFFLIFYIHNEVHLILH